MDSRQIKCLARVMGNILNYMHLTHSPYKCARSWVSKREKRTVPNYNYAQSRKKVRRVICIPSYELCPMNYRVS